MSAVINMEPRYKVTHVPCEHVPMEWGRVYDLLAPAVKRSGGRWTMGDLLSALCTNNQSLWIAYDDERIVGAMTTQIVTYPNKKMLAFPFIGGTEFSEWWDDMWNLMEQVASDCDCDGIEAVARFGFWPFLKTKGIKKSYITYEKFIQRSST